MGLTNEQIINAARKAIEQEECLMLTKEEVKILSHHLENEYLTHEEPARSVLMKIHAFADRK